MESGKRCFVLIIWACLSVSSLGQQFGYPCDVQEKQCVGDKICRMLYSPCRRPPCRTKMMCINPPLFSSLASCQSGMPILTANGRSELYCGRGPRGMKCPDETVCNIDRTDNYAVCCWKVYKPGVCVKPIGKGPCIHTCKDDNACPGDQKCCSNGCGMTCQNRRPEHKPGVCPMSPVSHLCMNFCQNDYDCLGSLKCCSNGCGKMCQNPANPAQLMAMLPSPMMPGLPSLHQQPWNKGIVRVPRLLQPSAISLGWKQPSGVFPGSTSWSFPQLLKPPRAPFLLQQTSPTSKAVSSLSQTKQQTFQYQREKTIEPKPKSTTTSPVSAPSSTSSVGKKQHLLPSSSKLSAVNVQQLSHWPIGPSPSTQSQSQMQLWNPPLYQQPSFQSASGKCPEVTGHGFCSDSCSEKSCPPSQKCCSIQACKVCMVPLPEIPCPLNLQRLNMCHLVP